MPAGTALLPAAQAGSITLGGDLTVNRMGYGAMRITGKGIWGPPADHQGALATLRRAVELGARFIETDLQITRDAQVIAIHDFTLDRTTSGKGQVHLLPLDQIRALDAGAWFGDHGAGAFSGEHVPTLKEILDFAKEHDVIFYLEIKSGPAWGIEHAVVAACSSAGPGRCATAWNPAARPVSRMPGACRARASMSASRRPA